MTIRATDEFSAVAQGAVEARTGLAQRREFLRHIEKLERELQQVLSAIAPANRRKSMAYALARPQLLSMRELELVRDALAAELCRAEDALAVQAHTRQEKRSLLKRMTEAPAEFRWAKVTLIDLGEPGCREWQSVPKLGPVGMLANWWRVRVSSGCP